MIRPIFFTILLTFSIFVLLLFSCSKPFKISSEEGNFSINFPGEASKKTMNMPAADGSVLNIVSYSYLSPDSNVVYLLSYNNIPNYASANPDSILDKAKIGPAQRMRTTIVEEKKLEIDGFPGLYFKGLGLDIAMVYHIYIVKDRMYQLAILNKIPREPEHKEIKGFMGSFKLLKKP
jgi:hypothetical protein